MQLSRPEWARLRREGDRRWQVALTVLSLVALVIGLVAVLAHAIPTTWQPTVILAAGSHYPMWAVFPALILALVVRRWATVVVALALTAVVLAYQVPPEIGETPPAHGTTVIVMQANLRLGQADPQPIVDRVRDAGVDVLTTEELTLPEVARLESAGIKHELPYTYLVASTPGAGNGIGIWSRYPLSDEQWLQPFALKVIRARVAMPGRAFTLVAAHILPPWPQAPDGWDAELGRFHKVLRSLPTSMPVVVGGDFNSTVDMEQFRDLLDGGYADGADQAGAGYTPTYPADRWWGPLIAIDHVLTRDAVATSLSTIALPNSDHRGLLARVVLRSVG